MGIELLGRAGEKALESSSLWAGRDHRGRPAGGKDSLLLHLVSLRWEQVV